MNKAAIVEAIAKKADISKKLAGEVFNVIFEDITKVVKKEGKITIPAFGTFKLVEREERMGRNPRTGETMKIKASKSMGFKISSTLKEKFN